MVKAKSEKERRFSQEQYEMLKRCSEKKDMTEWNDWREEQQDKDIFLEGALLGGAYLRAADLCGAQLENVDFSGANLKGAILSRANMKAANLRSADLNGANLNHACLKDANLYDADLQKCNLEGVNMKEANLIFANLENADLRCAHLENADIRSSRLVRAHLYEANLKGANLDMANLQSAFLQGSNLQGAFIPLAHLEGADLIQANLQDAHLVGANLQGTILREANLEGANFETATVDGGTLIWNCKVSRYSKNKSFTNFEGVGLDSARIDPGTKQLLEYNIRRKNWEEWYRKHSVLRWPVRVFWAMSDYGMSTVRVVGVFFILAFLFAAVYANWAYWAPPGIVNDFSVEAHEPIWHYFVLSVVRPVYFSVVTMTTLGFGDMYANKESIAGHVLLILQVILGYVLLGALVTRFAVLFTAGGPAGKFADEKKTQSVANLEE